MSLYTAITKEAPTHTHTYLTMTTDRLHVFVTLRLWLHVRMALPQIGHRLRAAGVHAHRMVRPFVRELPVGDLLRVATAPARPHADVIPALTPHRVGLRDAIRVEASIAAERGYCGGWGTTGASDAVAHFVTRVGPHHR